MRCDLSSGAAIERDMTGFPLRFPSRIQRAPISISPAAVNWKSGRRPFDFASLRDSDRCLKAQKRERSGKSAGRIADQISDCLGHGFHSCGSSLGADPLLTPGRKNGAQSGQNRDKMGGRRAGRRNCVAAPFLIRAEVAEMKFQGGEKSVPAPFSRPSPAPSRR